MSRQEIEKKSLLEGSMGGEFRTPTADIGQVKNAACITNVKTRAQIEKSRITTVSKILDKLRKIGQRSQEKWVIDPELKKKTFELFKDDEKNDDENKLASNKNVEKMGDKRVSKPGPYQKSPFVKREVSIRKKTSAMEKNVSECIFIGVQYE